MPWRVTSGSRLLKNGEARLAAALHHVRLGVCLRPGAGALARLAPQPPSTPVGEAALPQMWLR